MSHVCCAVLYYEEDNYDSYDVNDILEHHTGHAFDYYTLIKDFEEKRFKGLILKNGVENDCMYEYNGEKFAYKARIEDVNWLKTFKDSGIEEYADFKKVIDCYDFYDKNKGEIDWTEFNKFVKRMFERVNMVELADVHE